MATAKDDVFADVVEVAAGAYMTIVPATDEEAEVRAITIDKGGKVEISHYDGTREVIVNTIDAPDGAIIPLLKTGGVGFGITTANYLRVKNIGAAALEMGYTGFITKVPSGT